MYIMTALGCGLRSGLYIYIFNQFFRGLPKEIEEAAVVDGAGSFYTYFRIMLVNAKATFPEEKAKRSLFQSSR